MRRLLAVCLLFAPALCLGQVQPSPWGSVKGFGVDTVNRATLGNRIVIPIYSRATGVRAAIHLNLVYDSQFWSTSNGSWQPAAGFGWRLLGPPGEITSQQSEYDQYCGWYQDGGDGSYD